MKRYHWGMLAVVLAVGFSAFRTKKSNFASDTFYFIGSSTLQLQDETKWSNLGYLNDDLLVDCTEGSTITCRFTVSDNFVQDFTNGINHLLDGTRFQVIISGGQYDYTVDQVTYGSYNIISNPQLADIQP
jgi:hypothetical protein